MSPDSEGGLMKKKSICLGGWLMALAFCGSAFAGAHDLAQPVRADLPTLFIIGDSTVRNGDGTGKGGQWGWGDFIASHFDTDQINVVNDALGGTSSRTFYRDRWPGVKAMMKPGDFVIMQFGHNDSSPVNEPVLNSGSRSRGTIDGAGFETQSITNIITKRFEVVHSYGWVLEQFIAEARARGATPMVCSLIPRNKWNDDRVRRDGGSYAGWAGQVARRSGVAFLDINTLIADQYDEAGPRKVNDYFIEGAGPHTSEEGAILNAACVVEALTGLADNPLADYLK